MSAVSPCAASTGVIEVLIVGDDGQPVKDVAVTLVDGEQAAEQITPAEGLVRFEALAAKEYKVRLPAVDVHACELVGTRSLPDARAAGSNAPTWQAATEPEQPPATHTVAKDESITALALGFGFLIETIWTHEANAKLRKSRPMPFVIEGDTLNLPPREPYETPANVGELVCLHRLGVPLPFGIRFLDPEGQPRASQPWIAMLETPDGAEHELLKGTTDARGLLTTFLPAEATILEVTLGNDDEANVYRITLADCRPADDTAGLQTRLRALSYFTGPADGKLGDATREAVAAFQEDAGLTVTGDADEETLRSLLEISLS